MSQEVVRSLSISEHIDIFYERLDLEFAKLREAGFPLAALVSPIEPQVGISSTNVVAAEI
jgi:hypothetical protein